MTSTLPAPLPPHRAVGGGWGFEVSALDRLLFIRPCFSYSIINVSQP